MMFFRKRESPVRAFARLENVHTQTCMWFRDTSMASRTVAWRKSSCSCMSRCATGSVAGNPASGSWQFFAPNRTTPFRSGSLSTFRSSRAQPPQSPVHRGARLAEASGGAPPSHSATSFGQSFVIWSSRSGVYSGWNAGKRMRHSRHSKSTRWHITSCIACMASSGRWRSATWTLAVRSGAKSSDVIEHALPGSSPATITRTIIELPSDFPEPHITT